MTLLRATIEVMSENKLKTYPQHIQSKQNLFNEAFNIQISLITTDFKNELKISSHLAENLVPFDAEPDEDVTYTLLIDP